MSRPEGIVSFATVKNLPQSVVSVVRFIITVPIPIAAPFANIAVRVIDSKLIWLEAFNNMSSAF